MIQGDLIPQDALTQKLLVEVLAAMAKNYLQHRKLADEPEGATASPKVIPLTRNEVDSDSEEAINRNV